MKVIPGKVYYLKLTANPNDVELSQGASFSTENGVDMFCTNKLIEAMQEWPPPMVETEKIHRCGECVHLRPMKEGFCNREAYKRRPWGDCSVYAESEEYKRMVENHVSGCGWRYAPGRFLDQPACPKFTPKR